MCYLGSGTKICCSDRSLQQITTKLFFVFVLWLIDVDIFSAIPRLTTGNLVSWHFASSTSLFLCNVIYSWISFTKNKSLTVFSKMCFFFLPVDVPPSADSRFCVKWFNRNAALAFSIYKISFPTRR